MCMLHLREAYGTMTGITDKPCLPPLSSKHTVEEPVSHQRTVKEATPRRHRKGAWARLCNGFSTYGTMNASRPALGTGDHPFSERLITHRNGGLCGDTAFTFAVPRHPLFEMLITHYAGTVVLTSSGAAANSPATASPSRPLCATVSSHPSSNDVRAPLVRPSCPWPHFLTPRRFRK